MIDFDDKTDKLLLNNPFNILKFDWTWIQIKCDFIYFVKITIIYLTISRSDYKEILYIFRETTF